MPGAFKSRLSKSRVVAGAQCAKLLWWRVHEPDAPELKPDSVHQAVFSAGHRVGAAAQEFIGQGTEIAYSPALKDMVAATRAAIDAGAPAIFEASFIHEGVFVAVDILQRAPDGWVLVEVKSTKSVKSHHVLDAAVQLHVLRGCGVNIVGVELMHLGRKVSGGGDLFVRADIFDEAQSIQSGMSGLFSQLETVLSGGMPEVAPGNHCRQPRTCAFIERCIPPAAADATSRLYRISKKDLEKLLALGHPTVHTIPESYPLKPIADRQRRSLSQQRMIIEPGILEALDAIVLPAAFIDFESINPAIPPFADCEPYAQIPVQVSCHVMGADGSVTHKEWLGKAGSDPRPGLAQAVLAACEGAKTLVAYSAGFEKQMIRHLKAHVTTREADALEALCGQFVDLLPVMRNYVYHPDFGGRFGLKAVTAALLPQLDYSDLEVRAGGDASVRLADLLLRGEPSDADQRAALRRDLLAYCERDTMTMVALVARLRAAASKAEQDD